MGQSYCPGNTDKNCFEILEPNIDFEEVLKEIKKSVDYNSANILIINNQNKKLKTVAQHGSNCNLIKGMHFKMGAGLAAWLAQKKRAVCLPNIHRGARHVHNPIRSYLALPILLNDNVIGVMNLAHVIPNAYGTREIEALQNFAEELAPKINNLVSQEIQREKKSEGYYSTH